MEVVTPNFAGVSTCQQQAKPRIRKDAAIKEIGEGAIQLIEFAFEFGFIPPPPATLTTPVR